MDDRLKMLREGKTLTSSFLIKKMARKATGGVSFIRLGPSNYLEYVYISKPKNLDI
jgi:hypothetical protein